MVNIKCKHCGATFQAKPADIKRGWGKFCSKRCKALHQSKNHIVQKHDEDDEYEDYEDDIHPFSDEAFG